MKLRRKHTWLLTAPLAWLSGCGGGPLSGLTDRDPVVSLERPDPLLALRRSTEVESHGAESGAFSTAEWRLASDDPEERRLFLLTSARRRMQQQQMMMQMMVPLAQPPMHQQAAGPSAPTRTSKPAGGTVSKPTPAPQPAAVAQGTVPAFSPADMFPGGAFGGRRSLRGQRPDRTERSEAKLDREETAATVEADRIERAAAAEAERAEKAAQAEATIAERRLMAEAEIVERMTRARTELAERLAAAKDDRDRRINLAKEEHELRMEIIGINPHELGVDPVDEALSKLDHNSDDGESSLTRFTRFFRSSGSGEPSTGGGRTAFRPAVAAATESEPQRAGTAEEFPGDLIDRTLNHSNGLLDDPSIARFAATIPNVDAAPQTAAVNAPSRSGPESLHPSLFDAPADVDDYDALLSRESIAQTDKPDSENWSLLDSFGGTDAASGASAGLSGATAALGFPELSADASPSPVSEEPNLAAAAPALEPEGRKAPEDDVWILDGQRDLAGFDDLSPAGVGEGPSAADEFASDAFTQPGGLYAAATVAAPVATASSSYPAVADPESLAADPWLQAQAAATPAARTEGETPLFNWSSDSTSTVESVAPVLHQQLPSAHEIVRTAAFTPQSLRDACGPLPADLEALVLQLDIPEAGVRKEVLADLARLGVKARPALPAIRVLLEDSPLVAAHAAWTLWEIEQNESQTVQELVRLLHSGDPDVVQFTSYALGSLGPKALDAAPALRSERERFSGSTRIHVAEALTRIDAFDQASVEVLIVSLQHPETHVRWMSAVALGQTQVRYADLAVPALVGALHDPNPEVRSAAALSLGGFGSAASAAVPELQSRATLDSPAVQEAAQTALACIRKL